MNYLKFSVIVRRIVVSLVRPWKWWLFFCIVFAGIWFVSSSDSKVERMVRVLGFIFQLYGFLVVAIGQEQMANKYGLPTPAGSFKRWIHEIINGGNVVVEVGPAMLSIKVNPCEVEITENGLSLEERVKRVEVEMFNIKNRIRVDKRELLDKVDKLRSDVDLEIDAVVKNIARISNELFSDRASAISDGRVAFVVFLSGSVLTTFSQEIASLFHFV